VMLIDVMRVMLSAWAPKRIPFAICVATLGAHTHVSTHAQTRARLPARWRRRGSVKTGMAGMGHRHGAGRRGRAGRDACHARRTAAGRGGWCVHTCTRTRTRTRSHARERNQTHEHAHARVRTRETRKLARDRAHRCGACAGSGLLALARSHVAHARETLEGLPRDPVVAFRRSGPSVHTSRTEPPPANRRGITAWLLRLQWAMPVGGCQRRHRATCLAWGPPGSLGRHRAPRRACGTATQSADRGPGRPGQVECKFRSSPGSVRRFRGAHGNK
jgi:hypothetical protein